MITKNIKTMSVFTVDTLSILPVDAHTLLQRSSDLAQG